MSTQRGKLTAGKARERIASLEESIGARQHRLDQLEARLERSESPDERLLTAKDRLERRLILEREQLEKLLRLLGRDVEQPEESGEFFGSEEIDDLHRSFEEVRQNLAQVQARVDSNEFPRDLGTRLSSFEERVTRREEVDSELYSQVLSLQTALDQERQAVRRLSRRSREQDQSLDALREAVEDSVVATVDLAERLDELEESITNELAESKTASPPSPPAPVAAPLELEMLRELVEDARRGLQGLQRQVVESLAAAAQERQELRAAQATFVDQANLVEELPDEGTPEFNEAAAQLAESGALAIRSNPAPDPPISRDLMLALMARLETLESAVQSQSAPITALSQAADDLPSSGPKPAAFAKNGSRSRRVALFGTRPTPSD